MDSYIGIIGFVAAFCTTVSFVPQVLQTWRTRDLSGISLSMYSFFTFGIMVWLIYGLLQNDWPLVIANAITGSLSLTILVMKIKYSNNSNAVRE
jgi:MtN3 and saliva related transmembrane protein